MVVGRRRRSHLARRRAHTGTPALAFGGDGAPYSLGGDGALVRWTGETESRLADGATAFAMSADRTMFAFATGDGTVHLRVVGEPTGDLAEWQHLGAIVQRSACSTTPRSS